MHTETFCQTAFQDFHSKNFGVLPSIGLRHPIVGHKNAFAVSASPHLNLLCSGMCILEYFLSWDNAINIQQISTKYRMILWYARPWMRPWAPPGTYMPRLPALEEPSPPIQGGRWAAEHSIWAKRTFSVSKFIKTQLNEGLLPPIPECPRRKL